MELIKKGGSFLTQSEKRIYLEVNVQQAEDLIKALNLFARIGMGQINEIMQYPLFCMGEYDKGIC